VLGGGDRIAERRVHHDDALRGRGRNIDIVDADAGAADHLQVFRLFEDLRRSLSSRADREAVEVADQLGELVLVGAELRLEVNLDAAILEDLHGGGRESIGDENARGHDVVSRRLAQRVFGLCESPIDPRRQRHEIDFSIVEPHQMRRPGGASRCVAMS